MHKYATLFFSCSVSQEIVVKCTHLYAKTLILQYIFFDKIII